MSFGVSSLEASVLKHTGNNREEQIIDSGTGSGRMVLDFTAPLKKKTIKQKRLTRWCNPQTHILKLRK